MAYSTPIATSTTKSEIMNPCSMGFAPERHSARKSVFKPIAASAATIKNLLMLFSTAASAAGISLRLVSADIAKKPRMNQGKIERMRTFTPSPGCCCFCFTCRPMAANTSTAGMIASVRVSFTMVAKSPAASLKA